LYGTRVKELYKEALHIFQRQNTEIMCKLIVTIPLKKSHSKAIKKITFTIMDMVHALMSWCLPIEEVIN